MKLRLGFVSNSSSTSYVVALTRDFKATPEQLETFIKDCKGYEEDSVPMTNEEATETVAKIVEELCKQGEWSWGDGYSISEQSENMEHYHDFFFSCGDSFSIADADGGHGGDFLINILADNVKDKTKKLVAGKLNEDT